MVKLMKEILQKVILAAVLMSIPGNWSVSALSVESSSSGHFQSKAFTKQFCVVVPPKDDGVIRILIVT